MPQNQKILTVKVPPPEERFVSSSSAPASTPAGSPDDLDLILPRSGVTPFAVACLISGIYFAVSWLPTVFYSFSFLQKYVGIGKILSIFSGLSIYGLNSYAFAVALLTGPIAWQEIKAGKGRIKGKMYVIIGIASIGVMFLGKLLGIIR